MRAESRHKLHQAARVRPTQEFSLSSLIEGNSATSEQTHLPIAYQSYSKSKSSSRTPSMSSCNYVGSESLYSGSKSNDSTILDTSLHAKLSNLPHSDINTSNYPTRHQTHFTTESSVETPNPLSEMSIFPTTCYCSICDDQVTTEVRMVLPKVSL
mmetsp:Transcript_33880/g.59045  ORF Transcript_33880/g.59045 Transcript_33880/m.59045 type:complete len:155 (+) Transcript_33880:174-638(+)